MLRKRSGAALWTSSATDPLVIDVCNEMAAAGQTLTPPQATPQKPMGKRFRPFRWRQRNWFVIGGIGFGWPELFSFITSFLFYYQPGVDRAAVLRWFHRIHGDDELLMRNWTPTLIIKTIDISALIICYSFYYLEIPFVERCKLNPHLPWPWNSPDPKVREEDEKLRRRAWNYTIKQFTASVVLAYVFLLLGIVPDNDPRPETIPPWYVSMYHIIAGSLVFDFMFYWGHRALHHRWLYRFHKMHHEFKDTSIITSYYVHPVEILLTAIIPAATPAALFNMHYYTWIMWLISTTLSNVWYHCGYQMPFNMNPLLFVPMSTTSSAAHNEHHLRWDYNFGSAFSIWDKLMGTYRAPSCEEPYIGGDTPAYDPPTTEKLVKID